MSTAKGNPPVWIELPFKINLHLTVLRRRESSCYVSFFHSQDEVPPKNCVFLEYLNLLIYRYFSRIGIRHSWLQNSQSDQVLTRKCDICKKKSSDLELLQHPFVLFCQKGGFWRVIIKKQKWETLKWIKGWWWVVFWKTIWVF